MKLRTGSAAFGPVSGRGPQIVNATVTFPAAVKSATAVLTGFLVEFSGHDDHHLGQLDVQIIVAPRGIKGRNVRVKATLGLRDWSGDWNDMYDGQIFFAVFAE